MKKLNGLLGLMLSFVMIGILVVPSMAQNAQGRYDANGIGSVSYSLNSGGSFYGQLFNSASSSLFSLGFGSSKSTVGTKVLNWDSAGHVLLSGIGVPAVSSCGTAPSVAAGSDNAGDVSMGTANVATCTLTFAAAYTNVPHCFASNRTSKFVAIAQATTTTLVIVGTNSGAPFAVPGDVIDYVCLGHI